MPASDGVVVQIQNRRNPRAAFTIIQQQDRIRSTRDAVTLALTASAGLKLKVLW